MTTKICGIYVLRFIGTDKVYIGLSKDIYGRQRNHKYSLSQGIASPKLQNAYNLYGLPIMEILCECGEKELDTYEIEAITIFNSIENGFNTKSGGAVGPGDHISGDKNGRSKHSEDTYIAVFMDLVNYNNNYKDISTKYGVSIQIVDHIATGVSHKQWLQKLFPKEYDILVSKINSRTRFVPTILINESLSIEYTVYSILDFSNEFNIPKSTVSGIITGALKNAHGWKLKIPKKYTPKIKKEYTLINTNGDIVKFTNIAGFCRDHKISNRKGFTIFLNSLDSNITYLTWSHHTPEESYDISQSVHNHYHEI